MKNILQEVQNLLSTIAEIRYIDEDWGQLDDYSPNPPTQFPLVLIDVGNVQYSDIGRDQTATPVNRQMGTGTIVLRIANLKLTNTSQHAPKNQKQNAWAIWDIVEAVHKTIHGKCPSANAGQMIRTGLRKQKRDDGIQEFELTYKVSLSNV